MPKQRRRDLDLPTRTVRIEDVPLPIHSSFKAYCASRGYNMRAALIALMRQAAHDNEPLQAAQRSRGDARRVGRPPR